jgi:transcriptional regulator with GAF, ATPase, and Fis domain
LKASFLARQRRVYGAIKDRAGRFETAEGGTLFLDEIGEVPRGHAGEITAGVAGKTLRARGDDRTSRPTCASYAAFDREFEKGGGDRRFREDLYYRLHVVPNLVPPLRERRDDIPLLAGISSNFR